METKSLPLAVREFDSLPGSALVGIGTIIIVSGRSRASVNRDFASGKLRRIKIGSSTRAKVSEVRALIQAEPIAA